MNDIAIAVVQHGAQSLLLAGIMGVVAIMAALFYLAAFVYRSMILVVGVLILVPFMFSLAQIGFLSSQLSVTEQAKLLASLQSVPTSAQLLTKAGIVPGEPMYKYQQKYIETAVANITVQAELKRLMQKNRRQSTVCAAVKK